MREAIDFADLLKAAESGSQEAIWELVSRVSPYLYRVARRRMQPGLRVRYESADFIQMAWKSFLLREQPLTDFESEEQLQRFVAGIVANKVLMGARNTFGSQCRDASRETTFTAAEARLTSSAEPSPSHVVAFRDAWEVYLGSQPEHHQRIVHMKVEGATCQAIADELRLNEKTVRRVLKKLCSEVLA